MNEPKSTRDDLPEEEAPAYDEPPAGPADPLFEDDDAPAEPEAPEFEPQPPSPQEDLFADPVTAAAQAEVEPLPEPAPEPVLASESEPATYAVADPDPLSEPEPAPVEEPQPEPAPVSEPEPAPAPQAAFEAPELNVAPEAEPEAEPEPDTPEELAVEAASEALDDPHHDIFGPEPWEQAPHAAPEPPAPEPAPAPAPTLAEVFSAPAAEVPALRRGYEPQPAPLTATPGADASLEVKRSAFAVYLLYLSALVVVGIPLPIGAWLAYDRRKDAPDWLRSHYTYQIRTFWICMGGLALAGLVLFLPFALFPLTIVAVVIWLVARCFFGMVRLHRGEPIFNPQTWIV